jgi:hypothetical protein
MASLKRTRGPIAPGDRKRSPFDRSRIADDIIDSRSRCNASRYFQTSSAIVPPARSCGRTLALKTYVPRQLARLRCSGIRTGLGASFAPSARRQRLQCARHAPAAARAASGHAAAPPSSVMNSRLLIRSPRRRGRAASAGLRGRASLQS